MLKADLPEPWHCSRGYPAGRLKAPYVLPGAGLARTGDEEASSGPQTLSDIKSIAALFTQG